jgi:hypothetical protein
LGIEASLSDSSLYDPVLNVFADTVPEEFIVKASKNCPSGFINDRLHLLG